MQYKVVVTNYWINGIKYRRGDILEMSEERAAAHGVKIEPYFEPSVQPAVEPAVQPAVQPEVEPEVKPKRKRRTKAEMEAARKAQNEEE